MKTRILILVSLVLSSSLSTSVAQEKETPDAETFFKQIHGAWEVQSSVQDGEKKEKSDQKPSLIFNFADPYTLIMGDERCVLNLDTSTNPVTFRFSPLVKKSDTKRLILSGILKVEKEQLYIAMNRSPSIKTPPKKFESTKDSNVILLTLARPKLPEVSETEDAQ